VAVFETIGQGFCSRINPNRYVVNAYVLYSRTKRGLRKPENSNRKVIDFRHLPVTSYRHINAVRYLRCQVVKRQGRNEAEDGLT